ncbi:hypothetical protein [Novipirellula artificiosorum]|uniref:Uncharacterized protein n=1 Tax=Novipirellula artificiosorum TaxID=2528016 RepID=A0A5C6E043_9BACT|nr:hypothetical protein [Novipirellula artificiosorum]TWU42085.1 hypothetical protein Poly41_03810 [Novipirellula artificiosorum]
MTEINASWIGSELDPETRVERLHRVDLDYMRSARLMMLVNLPDLNDGP